MSRLTSKRFFATAVLCVMAVSLFGQINTKRLLDNGRNALHFEDYVLSMQYFNKVLSIKPNSTEAYYLRGIAKLELEDFLGAKDDFEKALQCNPFMPMLHYAKGFAMKRLGEYEDAEKAFSKALEFTPENTEYLMNRIEVYERQKKYDKALDDIDFLLSKKSTKKHRSYELLFLEKAQVLVEKGDTLGADTVTKQAIKENPSFAEFYSAQGLVSLLLKRDTAAVAMYEKAAELGSKNTSTYINLGLLNYRMKKYEKALNNYSKAIELDPNDKQARFNRAILRSEVGDWNNAMTDLDIIVSNDPDMDEAVYQRAVVALEIGEYNKAKQDFETLLRKYPDFLPAFYGHAQACEAVGQKRQASIDRYRAAMLENDAMNGRRRKRKIVATANIATSKSVIAEATKKFETESTDYYNDKTRGKIQDENASVNLKKYYVLSPYASNELVRKDSRRFIPMVEKFNQRSGMKLTMTNHDVPLSELLSKVHFDDIERIDKELRGNVTKEKRATLLTAKAINYIILQNPDSAIAELDNALKVTGKGDETETIIKFAYGTAVNKRMEIGISKGESPDGKGIELIKRCWTECESDGELGLYASFNLGNLSYNTGEYKDAIGYYDKITQKDSNFADAHFNKALAKMKDGGYDLESIKNDLSAAGQLGIYQAYSILKKLQNAERNSRKD
ncbi:MAG: tetratricopeptide repeat protein [Paludibacteraceae bacterium]|nr:tetratricopeptide repeat protein [Paludibacteraceae bacterium]